jgi:lipopolysaccharide/colanic/teichoic acid biosynthesis glycosyltransferase
MNEFENAEIELTRQKYAGLAEQKTYHAMKRVFDIAASITAIFVLSPIFIITAIAIKLNDGGPVIHRRYCVGRNGRKYTMYKFRSMRTDAGEIEKLLTPEQLEEYRTECKISNDPRITKVGKVIRRLSIDELPQLFSILKGDMSIVGPRPMVEFETKFYGDNINKVLDVTPGLTGYWQVNGRSNATYESGERQRLELYYVENQSLMLDIKILSKTINVIVKGDGVK